MKTLKYLLMMFVVPVFAHAQLQWDRKEIEFHPKATDASVKAEFRFTNTGSAQVVIESVKPECGCTTASLDKQTYEPGESGVIAAAFVFGPRTGLQKKGIRVAIRGEKEPAMLSFITHIPASIKVTPSFVFWRVGEKPQPKAIEVTIPLGMSMHVARVTTSDQRITAKIESSEPIRPCKISITPTDTDHPSAATLYIECADSSGVTKTSNAYAHIIGNAARPSNTGEQHVSMPKQ